jgi:hypothetical protein
MICFWHLVRAMMCIRLLLLLLLELIPSPSPAAAAAARLDNIMEHWSCCDDPCGARDCVLLDAVPHFKLFDFGTAVIYPGMQQGRQQLV